MYQKAYNYQKEIIPRYTFTSIGSRAIQKVVEFTRFEFSENLYNLAFGDLQSDGEINDQVRSNNGDLIRIMATLIQIIIDFTNERPEAKIFFSGSTDHRTRLYKRIIKTYYNRFSKSFVITALIEEEGSFLQVPFDPQESREYLYFLIEKT